MLITNKYENKCFKCKRTIPVDEEVEWSKSNGIRHVKCPSTQDKFRDIRELCYSEARLLTNCQLCESEANYTDKFYYENYRLCEKCWEENIGEYLPEV